MAEEFKEILESLKKEPIENKVNQLFDVIEGMMKLFLRTIDMVESGIKNIELKFDGNIKQLESKIESLKVKAIKKVEPEITKVESNLAEKDTEFNPTHLKPPPTHLKPPATAQVPKTSTPLENGKVSIRGMLMGELKELFKNRRTE